MSALASTAMGWPGVQRREGAQAVARTAGVMRRFRQGLDLHLRRGLLLQVGGLGPGSREGIPGPFA